VCTIGQTIESTHVHHRKLDSSGDVPSMIRNWFSEGKVRWNGEDLEVSPNGQDEAVYVQKPDRRIVPAGSYNKEFLEMLRIGTCKRKLTDWGFYSVSNQNRPN
jgi:hypothetical protein